MQEVRLPTHVDDPLMVLFWTSKEAGLVIVFIFAGFLLNSLPMGLLLAYIFTKFMKSYEEGNLEGNALAALYWMGFPVFKGIKDSYVKTYQ